MPLFWILKMDGNLHVINDDKMPYFKSWKSFKTLQALPADTSPTANLEHAPIPFFAAASLGVLKGYRLIFRDRSMGTDVKNYESLLDTLKLLCVDVVEGKNLDSLIKGVKAIKPRDEDYEEQRKKIQAAQDAAFVLLYAILEAGPEMESHKAANDVWETVLFVASHPKSFHFLIRKVLHDAYNQRFHITANQAAGMVKWLDMTDSDCEYESSDTEAERVASEYCEELCGYDSDNSFHDY